MRKNRNRAAQMHPSKDIRMLQEISFEVCSLESEGYHLQMTTDWTNINYRGMIHYRNGNRIDIFGYPLRGQIVVKKNQKVIKDRQIW